MSWKGSDTFFLIGSSERIRFFFCNQSNNDFPILGFHEIVQIFFDRYHKIFLLCSWQNCTFLRTEKKGSSFKNNRFLFFGNSKIIFTIQKIKSLSSSCTCCNDFLCKFYQILNNFQSKFFSMQSTLLGMFENFFLLLLRKTCNLFLQNLLKF